MRHPTITTAAWLTLVGCVSTACAQFPLPVPQGGMDEDANRACQTSLERILTAIDEGDGESLRFLLFADMRVTAQQFGRDAVIDCILARRSLETAARSKFGDAGLAAIGGSVRIIDADVKLIKKVQFEPRSEREMAGNLAPEMAPLVMRRSRDGRWRLMLRAITTLHDEPSTRTPEDGSARRIQSMTAIARATRWTAEQLRTGQVGSAEQLKLVFDKVMGDLNSEPK